MSLFKQSLDNDDDGDGDNGGSDGLPLGPFLHNSGRPVQDCF